MLDNMSIQNHFVDLPDIRLSYERNCWRGRYYCLTARWLPRCARMWDQHFPFFAQHYQTIRYDMRCAGKSETRPTTEPYTQYQDLYEFLQALHISRATLVGLSAGARTAIDFSLAYPEVVEKLVVVSPGMSGYEYLDPWTHEHGRKMLTALMQKNLASAVDEFLTLWIDGPYRTPAQVASSIRASAREMATHSFPLTRLAPNVQELLPPAIGRLAEIHAPLLVVLGEKDMSDIHTIGKLLHSQVTGAELVILPDVGHTLVMEKSAEFNMLVERFLRG